ncbi:hypothetical protein BSPWISOXPB_6340 [uncultured Gammaproteobacteria bacterium]|nr:hypothetical protein BSPWISOXPB_6340 [uncultured Gammaproteobacteria bacterium]
MILAGLITPNYTSKMGFAALKADGSIMAWVIHILEEKKHLLIVAIPRFIQINMPLPPLEPTAQLQCGVT